MKQKSSRVLNVVAVALALLFSAVSPVHAGTTGPVCINYSHQEQYGTVHVDLRYDAATGGYTTLSILWQITDYRARPGTYTWSHVINGKDVRTPEYKVKNDALHTILRKKEGTKVNWNYGDTYKFMGVLQSVDGNQYVALMNECTIVRR